ncbi:hypothetical protein CYMTET_14102 [Cymbomonas tetramitiformis]|uniref:Uncharacterized protein n=1 Tax=Cymbomonas tetramitiformis TaxID=36881 RepID=A0AAE0LAQ7_9CHLO|nr:hypothetical protein CYMTET_14102 [Cymbomonas tetramitiformis]
MLHVLRRDLWRWAMQDEEFELSMAASSRTKRTKCNEGPPLLAVAVLDTLDEMQFGLKVIVWVMERLVGDVARVEITTSHSSWRKRCPSLTVAFQKIFKESIFAKMTVR